MLVLMRQWAQSGLSFLQLVPCRARAMGFKWQCSSSKLVPLRPQNADSISLISLVPIEKHQSSSCSEEPHSCLSYQLDMSQDIFLWMKLFTYNTVNSYIEHIRPHSSADLGPHCLAGDVE